MPDGLIRIGQITAPHGVRGEVRVFPLTDFPERFESLGEVLVGEEARRVRASFQGTVKNLIILRLENISDRNAAEKLRGEYLQVPRAETPPLPKGHYYIFDLVGLTVIDPEGNSLGILTAVEEGPAHDIYVVTKPDRSIFRVPAVSQFVEQVDMDGRRLVIRPIPGLCD